MKSLAKIEPVDDILKDDNFKNGDEVSAKPESGENPKIEEG